MGKFKRRLSERKYEIVRTLHKHIKFLKNFEVPADYKGLIDFQLKLICSLLIHLNKNIFTKTYTIRLILLEVLKAKKFLICT